MQAHNKSSDATQRNPGHESGEFALGEDRFTDPIVQMLLRGEAQSVSEAEEKYLDANLHQVIALVESPLSDEQFRDHPLIALLLSHGSRDWEDSTL